MEDFRESKRGSVGVVEVLLIALLFYSMAMVIISPQAMPSSGDYEDYPAKLVRVIDGDTFIARVRFDPFDLYLDVRVRIKGVDACERFTPCGSEASSVAEEWFGGEGFLLRVWDDKSFDRWIGLPYRPGESTLRDILIQKELTK